MNRVLVFGTFDGIHEGHRAMLREAKTHGYVIVAIAPDAVVESLKGHTPKQPAKTRIEALKKEHLADEVILADDELHSWKILKKVKPSVIALGYDQTDLRTALEEFIDQTFPEIEVDGVFQNNPKKPTIVLLEPFQPERYKSSLLS